MSRVCSLLVLLGVFFFTVVVPHSYGTTITWNPNIEQDLGGYNFYCGTSSSHYTTVLDLGNVTSYAFAKLLMYEHVPYFVALTAYDISDNESSYSLELSLSLDDDIDYEDNCPDVYNPDQKDTYPPIGNGIGDACDCEADFACDGDVDGGDVALFLTSRSAMHQRAANSSLVSGGRAKRSESQKNSGCRSRVLIPGRPGW